MESFELACSQCGRTVKANDRSIQGMIDRGATCAFCRSPYAWPEAYSAAVEAAEEKRASRRSAARSESAGSPAAGSPAARSSTYSRNDSGPGKIDSVQRVLNQTRVAVDKPPDPWALEVPVYFVEAEILGVILAMVFRNDVGISPVRAAVIGFGSMLALFIGARAFRFLLAGGYNLKSGGGSWFIKGMLGPALLLIPVGAVASWVNRAVYGAVGRFLNVPLVSGITVLWLVVVGGLQRTHDPIQPLRKRLGAGGSDPSFVLEPSTWEGKVKQATMGKPGPMDAILADMGAGLPATLTVNAIHGDTWDGRLTLDALSIDLHIVGVSKSGRLLFYGDKSLEGQGLGLYDVVDATVVDGVLHGKDQAGMFEVELHAPGTAATAPEKPDGSASEE